MLMSVDSSAQLAAAITDLKTFMGVTLIKGCTISSRFGRYSPKPTVNAFENYGFVEVLHGFAPGVGYSNIYTINILSYLIANKWVVEGPISSLIALIKAGL
jgi:hypothetical protein